MKKLLIIFNESIPDEVFLEKNKLLKDTCKKLGWVVDFKSNVELQTYIAGAKVKALDGYSAYNYALFFCDDYPLAKNLELLGVKVINSSLALLNCSNKATLYQELVKNGVNIPKTFILPNLKEYKQESLTRFVDNAIIELGLPMVVKGWYGNSGQNIYLAKSKGDVYKILDHFKGQNLLLQEYIAEASGSDIRIFVINGKVITGVRRTGAPGDFRSNLSQGGHQEKYIPTVIDTTLAQKAVKSMNCHFGVVDILKSVNGPLVLEVNAVSNINKFYETTGINVAELLLKSLK